VIDPTALPMRYGELWDLDGLAAACAESGRYEVCLVSVPLRVPGGVASPGQRRRDHLNSIAAVVKRPRNVQPSAS